MVLSVEEGIYGIRCEICMKLVEDWSDSGEHCKEHIDNEQLLEKS